MGRECHGVNIQGKRTFNTNLPQEDKSMWVKDSRASTFCFGDSMKLQTESHIKCVVFLYFLFGTSYIFIEICSSIIKIKRKTFSLSFGTAIKGVAM